MKKICVIGMGNMGSAICDALRATGCDKGDNVEECVVGCDVFVIAVKPQDFEGLCKEIGVDLSEKLVISIMAGVCVERVGSGLNMKKVARVMPNLPLKVGRALSGWTCSSDVTEEERDVVREILKSFGEEIYVEDEDKIDAITALSGSGPAYFYYLTEMMVDAAQKYGFSVDEARKIAKNTFFGSAKLAENLNEDVSGLREKVTSKGGTTEAALKVLQDKDFGKIFGEAVEAAYKRAKELNS